MKKIEAGAFEGKQTDWGYWVARVKKDQTVAFIGELYGDHEQPKALAHLRPRYEALKAFVATLDPEKTYALVASEL